MTDRTSRGLGLAVLLAFFAACGTDDGASGSTFDAAVPDREVDHSGHDAASGSGPDASKDPEGDAGSEIRKDAGLGDDGNDGGTPTGPKVDISDRKLREFALDPKALDPSIADSTSTQCAQLDTRSTPLGRLVIFLPGANNVPGDWRNHGRKLAEFGFHVLIPHYNNRWSSNGTCDGKPSSCANDTRWEALSGEDTSSAISIARADSAEGRVITMLKYLVGKDPGGDWGYYLTQGGGLAYDRIIIAGISHGAASAGMYAARRPFARNVMHSSGPAGDSKATKMTPISEWYAFVHTADPAYDAIMAPLKSFGVPGEPTNVDGQTPPFGNSHRLITSAMSKYPHVSTCVHKESPNDGMDHYVFEPVWRYLYGAPTAK